MQVVTAGVHYAYGLAIRAGCDNVAGVVEAVFSATGRASISVRMRTRGPAPFSKMATTP